MSAILWQFHQMLRILPGNGRLVVNGNEPEIERLLQMGCWTPVERYSSNPAVANAAQLRRNAGGLELHADGQQWQSGPLALPGLYNLENATAAILAARHAGVAIQDSLAGLQQFRGVKRRLEHLGTFNGVRVYDDFAHHPTAIRRTVDALRESAQGRVLVVVEPRSNSMKLGAHRAGLSPSLAAADRVWAFQPENLPWRLSEQLADLPAASVSSDINAIVHAVVREAQPGDEVVIMSNGGFGGIHKLLCAGLESRTPRN
jgi:UDP-N-acetylmuramate: L-alanyl-gamma-D-glutamyl-meso-diaminopimelate ligase